MFAKYALFSVLVVIGGAIFANYAAFRGKADGEALTTLIRTGRMPDRTASRRDLDPSPTGSIAARAQATRLDPCGPDQKR